MTRVRNSCRPDRSEKGRDKLAGTESYCYRIVPYTGALLITTHGFEGMTEKNGGGGVEQISLYDGKTKIVQGFFFFCSDRATAERGRTIGVAGLPFFPRSKWAPKAEDGIRSNGKR